MKKVFFTLICLSLLASSCSSPVSRNNAPVVLTLNTANELYNLGYDGIEIEAELVNARARVSAFTLDGAHFFSRIDNRDYMYLYVLIDENDSAKLSEEEVIEIYKKLKSKKQEVAAKKSSKKEKILQDL